MINKTYISIDNKIFNTVEYDTNNFKTENISIDQTYPQPHPWQLRNINAIDDKVFIFDTMDDERSYIYCYDNNDFSNYETFEIPNSSMLKQSVNLIISASNKEVTCFNKNLDKIKSFKIPNTSNIYTKNSLNSLFTHIINEKYLCCNEHNLELTVLDLDTGEEKLIQDKIDGFDRKFTYRDVYPTQNKDQVFLVGENRDNDDPSVGTYIYAIADLNTGKILEYIDKKDLIDKNYFIDPWTTTIYIQNDISKTIPETNKIGSHILKDGNQYCRNKFYDEDEGWHYDNKIYDFRNSIVYNLEGNMSLVSSTSKDINSYLLLKSNEKTTICVFRIYL